MFSFFHRTPKIHLDCFTYDVNVYLNTPIVHASKTIPDWWKKLPSYKPIFGKTEELDHCIVNHDDKSVKECYGIIELYKKGIVIESWCDISIKSYSANFNYYYSYGEKPQHHSKLQIGEGFPNYHHLKLLSPWLFSEKTGVKFVWIGAEWSLDRLNIKMLPAVINFDIVSFTNINFMFPCIENEFFIPIGQPLVHVIPITEKKLILKNHLVDKAEYDKKRIDSSFPSIYGWRKILQLRKRNKERGTCPFGFGDKS